LYQVKRRYSSSHMHLPFGVTIYTERFTVIINYNVIISSSCQCFPFLYNIMYRGLNLYFQRSFLSSVRVFAERNNIRIWDNNVRRCMSYQERQSRCTFLCVACYEVIEKSNFHTRFRPSKIFYHTQSFTSAFQYI